MADSIKLTASSSVVGSATISPHKVKKSGSQINDSR